ncbi:MAG: LytTR family DNA-binding domain-containing protein [Christensenellales bacterium]
MKIKIEVTDDLAEDEITIRCKTVDENIMRLHDAIRQQAQMSRKIVFYKQNLECYFPIDEVLFFETDAQRVFAHTVSDSYRIRLRLYELEEMLPKQFVRAAKSTIVNTSKIFAITSDLTASRLIRFSGTHKQVYVSRHYYRALRDRLTERSTHNE